MNTLLSPPSATATTHSIHMTPDELARLDTSITNYLNTYTVPSLSHLGLDRTNTENNMIGGGLTAGRLMSSSVQNNTNTNRNPPLTPYSVGTLSTRPFPPTPPQTSPTNDLKHTAVPAKQVPLATGNSNNSNATRLYEERIEVMRRNEQERLRILEQEHQQQIDRLSAELERYRVKADQLAGEKARLEREVDRLSSQLQSATTSNTNSDVRLQYEQRIADLLATFESERQASKKLLQTHVRSQLALLLPKLKQRFTARLHRHLDQLRLEHSRQLDSLRLQHVHERQLLQRQAREDAELQFKEWQQKAKEKMRVRVMQARNEAERRVLESLRQQ